MGRYARHSTSLCFLTLVPCQLPNKAGTHTDVLILEWLFGLATDKSIRRFALSGEMAVFQVFAACLPSRLTRRQTFTLNMHRDLETGGSHSAADLALPPFQTKIAFSEDSLPSEGA